MDGVGGDEEASWEGERETRSWVWKGCRTGFGYGRNYLENKDSGTSYRVYCEEC